MIATIRTVLGPLLELGRLFSTEVAYQQDILNKWMLLDRPSRAQLHRAVVAVQQSVVPIRDLLTTQHIAGFPLTAVTIDAADAWYPALLQKITDKIFNGNAARLPELPNDFQGHLAEFQTTIREINTVHQTFVSHKIFLDELETLTKGLPASGVVNSGQWPRLQQLGAVRRKGSLQCLQPAALREIVANEDASLGNLPVDGMTILAKQVDAAVVDPLRVALRTAAQTNVARQEALRQKWHYFVENWKRIFAERKALEATGMPDANPFPTAQELITEMEAMAGGYQPGLDLLAMLYTVQNIMDMVRGTIIIPK